MKEYGGSLTHREWQILMPPSSRTDLGGLQNELRERQERIAPVPAEPATDDGDGDGDGDRLEVGTKVELQGLTKSPALNGQTGTVAGYADDGVRVIVSMMSFDGRISKVAAQVGNLKVLAEAPPADPRFSPAAAKL